MFGNRTKETAREKRNREHRERINLIRAEYGKPPLKVRALADPSKTEAFPEESAIISAYIQRFFAYNGHTNVVHDTAEVCAEYRRTYHKRFGFVCPACGLFPARTLDHIIPVLSGGTHTTSNIAYLCGRCNSIKGDNEPFIWLLSKKPEAMHIYCQLSATVAQRFRNRFGVSGDITIDIVASALNTAKTEYEIHTQETAKRIIDGNRRFRDTINEDKRRRRRDSFLKKETGYRGVVGQTIFTIKMAVSLMLWVVIIIVIFAILGKSL